MPKDKPNEQEIKKIMAKVKDATSGGKGPPQKEPEPETKEKPPVEKKEPSKEGNAKTATGSKDPEKAALKQTVKELTKRLDKVEGLLGKAMAQAAGEGSTQEKKTTDETGQQEVKEKKQQEITAEQELAMLQQMQRQAQQQQGQQGSEGQVPAGLGNPLYAYLLGKTLDTVGKVLPAALQRGGGGGEGGTSFSQIAEALVIDWLKRNFGAGGGGGGNNAISLDQLKAFTEVQKVALGGLLSFAKGLPKSTGEKVLEKMIGSPTERAIE